MTTKNEKNFELIFKGFQDKKAVLSLDDKDVILPKEMIRGNAQEGDKLIFNISSLDEYETRKRITAKEILNEILG